MGKSYLIAGHLIDGTGAPPMQNVGITVEDGIITDISPHSAPPEGCEVFDYSDRYIMPGLINAHVHLAYGFPEILADAPNLVNAEIAALKELREYLEHGVTHIRVCGASTYLDLRLKQNLAKGTIKGPGMIVAGQGITMTGGAGHRFELETDGVDQARKATRTVIKNGADFIKTVATGSVGTPGIQPGAAQLSREELATIVTEAHHAGKKVAVHAHGAEGIHNAVLAGVDSIEHGSYLRDDTIALMKEQGTYLVSTLTIMYFSELERREGNRPEEELKKTRGLKEANEDSFRRAYRAGIKMAAGTDVSGGKNSPAQSWMELKLMVDNGAFPMDAIVAATRNGADLLGILDTHGTLERGKACDLMVLPGNPLEDIAVTSRVGAVFQNGEKVCFDQYLV